jgi:hypothetical protein
MALNYPNRQYKAILVSISQKQAQFLKETGFKPSRLLQQAIEELMNATNPGDLKDILRFQKQKINILTETMLKQKAFIEQKGLLQEYIK